MNPMTDDRPSSPDEPNRPAVPRTAGRRSYRPPRLVALGDLRGMTFGGSPGLNDSGSEFVQEPPGGL